MESSSSPTGSYIDEKPMITGEFFFWVRSTTPQVVYFISFSQLQWSFGGQFGIFKFAMISASILNEIRNECDKGKVFSMSMAAKRNEIESIVWWLMSHKAISALIGYGVSNLSNAHFQTDEWMNHLINRLINKDDMSQVSQIAWVVTRKSAYWRSSGYSADESAIFDVGVSLSPIWGSHNRGYLLLFSSVLASLSGRCRTHVDSHKRYASMNAVSTYNEARNMNNYLGYSHRVSGQEQDN